MVQWAKDPALSLLWLRMLLWGGFHPWPRNCHRPQALPSFKKKKKKRKKRKTNRSISEKELGYKGERRRGRRMFQAEGMEVRLRHTY